MELNQIKPKASVRDIFINLGAFVALYTVLIALLNLLFTVINKAYPQITGYPYYYGSSASISLPVATLIIFFPIFVYLMWFLQRDFVATPEKRDVSVHKWLTYITLFISGLTLAGDLVTILYYFLDGQEFTTAFVLKFLVVLVVAFAVFMYFISNLRNRLTLKSEKIWIGAATLIVLASIIWGFSVIGSPRSQRLAKYDQQKTNDLQSINSGISAYYASTGVLPENINDLKNKQQFIYGSLVDMQTNKPYEYQKTGDMTYELCADFNKATPTNDYQYDMWKHAAGRFCFTESVNPIRGIPQKANLIPLQ